MMNIPRIATMLTLLFATTMTTYAEPIEWPLADGGNGHFYELVVRNGSAIGWHAGASEAATMRFMGATGHLATITSPAEQEFIRTRFPDPPDIYIGGYQDRSAPDFWSNSRYPYPSLRRSRWA